MLALAVRSNLKLPQLHNKNESDNNIAPLKSKDKAMPQQVFPHQIPTFKAQLTARLELYLQTKTNDS